MHDFFAENRCDDADGREYFSVPFEKAVEVLKTKDPRLHRKEKDLHKEKIMLNVISKLYYMNDFDLGYLAGLADFTTIPEEAGEPRPITKEELEKVAAADEFYRRVRHWNEKYY